MFLFSLINSIMNKKNANTIAINSVINNDYISNIAEKLLITIKKGGKILLCGNGGSAADSDHIAAEFVGRFEKDRDAINAISLCSNSALITAIGNDFGFQNIFSRQIEAIGKKDDVLIAISTSGKSKNILKAVETALKLDLHVIFISGNNLEAYQKTKSIMKVEIESKNTAAIQEAYMFLLHNVVREIDDNYF